MFLHRRSAPLVSICIPVHNTERHLPRCLGSVVEQDFPGLELVLINDNSSGKDEKGRSCKKIVRDFEKKSKIPVVYIEHFSYVPLLETRRELVEQAHGLYILMVDSDDFLAAGAVKTLYENAKESGADITCATERIYHLKDGNPQITENHYSVHKEGSLTGRAILDSWLNGESSAFLWAKLIKRELFLTAMNEIPYMDCSFSVDTPMYFFIAYHAKSYYGISNLVYYYLENEGITSNKEVSDLEVWRRQCTVSSCYSLLLTFEGDLNEEEKEAVRKMSRHFIRNSILRLRNCVIPSLQPQAYEILCEYWGKDYVEAIEKLMEENQKSAQ